MKENETDVAIQDQYDEAFQVCYGCGARNHAGLQIKSHEQGDSVTAEFLPEDHHLGVPGVVYGGLIASLIDCHGIATGAQHFKTRDGGTMPRCVTASLHVDYRAPTPMNGHPIKLTARVIDASERKAVVDVKVRVDGTLTAEGQVIAVCLKEQPGD